MGFANIGLSAHSSWFSLGGPFGATYDSLNYDAFGDTEGDTWDSFILPGTCYVASPSLKVLDTGLSMADNILPVICVNSIMEGESITISVSFLDEENPPAITALVATERELTCGSPVTTGKVSLDMSDGKSHLYHIKGTGSNGKVTLDMCLISSNSQNKVKAYFYDSYPYAYLAFGAPPAYGSFRSLEVKGKSSCREDRTLYQSEYGNTYILFVEESPLVGDVYLKATASCHINHCLASEYEANGVCNQCPPNTISAVGSVGLESCGACPAGFNLMNSACVISNEYDSTIFKAVGWRLWAHTSHTDDGWRWDIHMIELFSSETCEASSLVRTDWATFVDSGNADTTWYGPQNAFQQNGLMWGGRDDRDDAFYIGIEFNVPTTVRCIKFNQDTLTHELRVQALPQFGGDWENVWIQKDLSIGTQTFSIASTSPSQISTSATTTTTTPTTTNLPTCPNTANKRTMYYKNKKQTKTKKIKCKNIGRKAKTMPNKICHRVVANTEGTFIKQIKDVCVRECAPITKACHP